MRHTLVIRARILGAFFILVALLLIVRLYFLQVVHGADYRTQAVAQYVEQSPDTQDRGNIFFTTKDGDLVSAAVMQTGWRIAIDPQELKDPAAAYAAINAIVPIDSSRFFADAAKTGDPYEEVGFQVPDAAGQAVQALGIPGVILAADQWRFYPGHELASQALGFVGYLGTSTTKVGVTGL